MSTVSTIADVEFGSELPSFEPDTSIEATRRFGKHVGWDTPRLHRPRRRPQGRFAGRDRARRDEPRLSRRHDPPRGRRDCRDRRHRIRCSVPRCWVDQPHNITGVVTDVDEDAGTVEIRHYGHQRGRRNPRVRHRHRETACGLANSQSAGAQRPLRIPIRAACLVHQCVVVAQDLHQPGRCAGWFWRSRPRSLAPLLPQSPTLRPGWW